MSKKNTPDIVSFATTYLRELFEAGGLALEAELRLAKGTLFVNLVGEDVEPVILRGGFFNRDLIDALQHVLGRSLETAIPNLDLRAISIDADDYRERRKDELEAVAERIIDKISSDAIDHIEIYGMDSIDRRAVHRHVGEAEDITTMSDGYGVLRRLIISAS